LETKTGFPVAAEPLARRWVRVQVSANVGMLRSANWPWTVAWAR